MKASKKVLLGILLLFGFALIVSLPFGIKIIQEEGWEGVWNRKRATITKAVPGTAPIVDEAEKTTKRMGLQK